MPDSIGDSFRKVTPGEPQRIPAELHNANIDTIRAVRGMLASRMGGSPLRGGSQPGLVRVLNDSGADLDEFEIVGLAEPVFGPDDNMEEFQRAASFSGVEPTADHADAFGILLEPMAAGSLGWAVVSGMAVCKVLATSETTDYLFAQAQDGDATALALAESGAAQVLWREPGTDGTFWALVRLGVPGGGGGGDTEQPGLLTQVGIGGIEQNIVRTELGTAVLKSPITRPWSPSFTFDVNPGDLVIVLLAFVTPTGDPAQQPANVTVSISGHGTTFTRTGRTTRTSGVAPWLQAEQHSYYHANTTGLTTLASRQLVINRDEFRAPDAIAVIAFKLRGSIQGVQSTPPAGVTGSGTSGTASTTLGTIGLANCLSLGYLATMGPVEDTAPTFGASYITPQRIGTTGGVATTNVTLAEAYLLSSSPMPRPMPFSGITSREFVTWVGMIQTSA